MAIAKWYQQPVVLSEAKNFTCDEETFSSAQDGHPRDFAIILNNVPFLDNEVGPG